jgi:threonine dehydratase
MAAQGTMIIELLQQIGEVDSVVVSIGGGGLISGLCLQLGTILPKQKSLV